MRIKEKKYILFCTQFFRGLNRPGLTGGLISNFHLMRALSQNHDLIILSFDEDSSSLGEDDGFFGTVIREPMPKWRGIELFMKYNDFVVSKIKEVIDIYGEPSVFISIGSTVFSNILFKNSNVKTVSFIQAFENFSFFAPNSDLDMRISLLKRDVINHMQNRRAVRESDLVLVNSDYMKDMVRRRFRAKNIKTIFPLLDIPVQPPRHIDKFCNKIGFSGRAKVKNLDLVLELSERMPEFLFVVFGCGEKPSGAFQNVEFVEWEFDREKMYSSADLWLVPSRWPEPFGRVSVEAQAMGCHVLVANGGGLPETVPNKCSIVKSLNPSDWESRIRGFFADPEAQIQPRPLISRFLQKFSREEFERQVEETFNALIASEKI